METFKTVVYTSLVMTPVGVALGAWIWWRFGATLHMDYDKVRSKVKDITGK